MTNEELVNLIQDGIDPVDNMEQLYKQNKGYIYRVVKRYAYNKEDLEDLLQEAYFGLNEAVQRYENTGETKFMTYASFWIRQSVTRYQENNSNVIRIPVHMIQNVNRYRKVVSTFKGEHGREPTDAELRSLLEVGQRILEDIKKTHCSYKSMASIDKPIVSEGDEFSLSDTLADKSIDVENNAIDDLMKEYRKNELWKIVARECNEEENTIINAVYKTSKVRREIGQDLGITEAKVTSFHDKALRRLRYPRVRREIQNKFEINIAGAYSGGVASFNRTWTSSTERVALKNIDLEQELLRELMRK